jgi:hypothetical protein
LASRNADVAANGHRHLWNDYIFGVVSVWHSNAGLLTFGTNDRARALTIFEEQAMLFRRDRTERLAGIAHQVRTADRASAELVSAIASEISHRNTCGSTRIQKLIAAGAWSDTALALIASELPQWKLRRLAYDDGEWYCTLSPQREFPEWLDEGVETHHENLALALFKGLVAAALQRQPMSAQTPTPTVPRIRIRQFDPARCDNFA